MNIDEIKEYAYDKIVDELDSSGIDADLSYYLNGYEVDLENLDSLTESVKEHLEGSDDMFNVDIIYYSSAIKYLSENDASLNESLGIAEEYGYSCGDLNSEILASLLASQNLRESFYDDFPNLDWIADEVMEMIEECSECGEISSIDEGHYDDDDVFLCVDCYEEG